MALKTLHVLTPKNTAPPTDPKPLKEERTPHPPRQPTAPTAVLRVRLDGLNVHQLLLHGRRVAAARCVAPGHHLAGSGEWRRVRQGEGRGRDGQRSTRRKQVKSVKR